MTNLNLTEDNSLIQSSRSIFSLANLALVAVITLALNGCSSLHNDDIKIDDDGEQQIYSNAQRHLENKKFDMAILALQLLENRYPFGRYAEQAQLELIYAHYGAREYEAAIESANRFIRLHTQHPSIDYAYYIKALAIYDAESSFFERIIGTDKTKRDISHIKEAFAQFNQLLTRFPDSQYAPDTRARMVHMRNIIARHEIHVANYYFRRGAYMAALNRGQWVVEHMQGTSAVADGLAIMAQAYILLGLNDLSIDSIETLKTNYPNHPSLDENGKFQSAYNLNEPRRSRVNQLTFGLLDPPKPPQFSYQE